MRVFSPYELIQLAGDVPEGVLLGVYQIIMYITCRKWRHFENQNKFAVI